jgi:3-oxoacyl-[acyl-carrier-protein] synthase I
MTANTALRLRPGLPALGLATPLGVGKAETAASLLAGKRADLAPMPGLAGKPFAANRVEGELAPIPQGFAAWDSRNNRLLLTALAEIEPEVTAAVARYGARRIAIVLGTSTSGIAEGETALARRRQTGAWPQGFDYRAQEPGSPADFLARYIGTEGPAYVVATACSSSAKVFASARRLLRLGLCDAAIVGGADTLCGLTGAGFRALGAMSSEPTQPFRSARAGINIGEGAALFLMTREPAELALLGVGETSDAHHVSAPDPQGGGALAAMRLALDDAGLAPGDIAYVNLHGTGTALNDAMESGVVSAVFGPKTPCSSTKALTGHTLGAAGAIEAAFLWLLLSPAHNSERRLAPQAGDGAIDPALAPIAFASSDDRLPATSRLAMLSNSFAFGGSNCSLILGRGW